MNAPSVTRVGRFPVVVLFGLLMAAGSSVRAEDPLTREIISETRAARQRKARAAAQAVRKLALSPRQIQRLLPILEKAAALRIEGYEQEAKLLPEMIEAFGDFAQEAALNQGFTRRVERRAARVNQQGRDLREETVAQLIELEEQVAAILTQSQRELVEPARFGRGGKRHHADRDRALAVRRQLEDAHRRIHPRLGRLGEQLLHPAAAEELYEIARVRPSETIRRAAGILECGTESIPISQFDSQKAEVKRLRDEINNWNLINGLHLSPDQIERIVAVYDEDGPKLQAATRKGRRPPEKARPFIAAVERNVEETLNAGQRRVLADYNPCLIPPTRLKDPVRVGQANDHSHIERWLTRVRKASGEKMQKLIARALEQEAEHFGKPSAAEFRERETLLLQTARRVAAMSDLDFELDKAELAERIAPRNRIKELKAELDTVSKAQGLPGRIAQFILKPQFVEQLRQRGRQLARGVGRVRADLAKGPQADNCDRTCAIKKLR